MVKKTCVLKLNEKREIVGGSVEQLSAAVRRGADVQCYTTFDYAEHMGVPQSHEGLVHEMMSFSTVYWLEGGHIAGIQTTRYPANSSLGFLDLPSLSFFLNNENGQHGVARLFLDGRRGAPRQARSDSEKYKVLDAWDDVTPCPSENFTYDFGEYAWWADDCWQELLSHDATGLVIHGSLQDLRDAFHSGARLKVAVRDLCAGLAAAEEVPISHEVFVELHSLYNHHDSGFLGGESQPLVRVSPGVPLKYRSGNWNCGWILPRTDGMVYQVVLDPYTRKFAYAEGRFSIRWFAR